MGNGGGDICLGYEVIHRLIQERHPEGTYDIIHSQGTSSLIDVVPSTVNLDIIIIGHSPLCRQRSRARKILTCMVRSSGTMPRTSNTPTTRGTSLARLTYAEAARESIRPRRCLAATLTQSSPRTTSLRSSSGCSILVSLYK